MTYCHHKFKITEKATIVNCVNIIWNSIDKEHLCWETLETTGSTSLSSWIVNSKLFTSACRCESNVSIGKQPSAETQVALWQTMLEQFGDLQKSPKLSLLLSISCLEPISRWWEHDLWMLLALIRHEIHSCSRHTFQNSILHWWKKARVGGVFSRILPAYFGEFQIPKSEKIPLMACI